MRAVVIGAGIGGLCTAVGLRRIGFDVVALERSPRPRTTGGGISLLSNAGRALDELGVGEDVRARAAVMLPGGEGVRTAAGRRLMRPADPDFVRDHGLTTYVLPRADLHDVLHRALPAGAVRHGAEVVDTRGLPDGTVRVRHRDAAGVRELTADVVVAADGVHSATRRRLVPAHPGPVYSGHSVWRGIAEVRRSEPGGSTWGRGREFGRMPLADGRVYWYAVTNARPGERHADEHAEVRRRFGDWHAPIGHLIAGTPPATVLYHDVFELVEPLPSYVAGGTALLGDAAHAMTSDLGQGACQAIEDAVVLCAALARAGTVPEALTRYDAERRPRAQQIVEASRRMGRFKLRERRLSALVRNAAVALVPPRAGEQRMAQIGDWHPPALPAVQS